MPVKFTNRKTPQVMFANCGHFPHRRFEDSARLNYISAGRGKSDGVRPYFFSNQIRKLILNDILCVYRKEVGYVGIARVISKPMPITNAFLNGVKVTTDMFNGDMYWEGDEPGYEEWLVEVEWLTPIHLGTKPKSGSCFGIYAKPHVVCSLANQPILRKCLQNHFNLKFKDYIPDYVD